MKRIITCLSVALSLVFGSNALLAQGTDGEGIVMVINSNLGVRTALEDDCSWNGTSGWGGALTEGICGEVVWAYDMVGNDSLACDSITAGSLAGKIAVIRRGTCEFGAKALHAERAGAVAVIIINHFATAADNGCTMLNMGAGAVGAQVTIPLFGGCRDLGTYLDEAIKAGNATVCLVLPNVTSPTAAYHYATPVSQVDSLGAITMHYINRSADPQTDVVAKVDIVAPNGSVTSATVPMASVAPGLDTLVIFPVIKPAAVKGKFKAVFSVNKATESRDTLIRNFEHTDYTFATDNLVIDPFGVGTSNADFINAGLFIQNANLYITGSTGGVAKYATFGLSNVDTLFVPGDPSANQVVITLYDADVDGDGATNIASASATFDDLADGIVGQTTYQMTGNEGVDSMLNVEIYDYTDPSKVGVTLKPNHPYYLSLAYDGNNAGTGRCLRFSNTLDEYYLPGFYATPLYLGGTMYNSGWAGAEVITRMQLDGFNPSVSVDPNILDKAKMEVTPNPANEFVRLNLNLNEVSPSVYVNLIDGRGRTVRTATQRNLQNGTISIETKDLPSGTYLVWVRTAEGGRVEKVAICH